MIHHPSTYDEIDVFETLGNGKQKIGTTDNLQPGFCIIAAYKHRHPVQPSTETSLLRRRQLFAKRAEQLEEQKAETLAHLEDVDRRLKEKQRRTEERIERQKKEAVEREMGRSVAMEEKEQSLLDESMELEAKRSAKEIYMESVAEEREREIGGVGGRKGSNKKKEKRGVGREGERGAAWGQAYGGAKRGQGGRQGGRQGGQPREPEQQDRKPALESTAHNARKRHTTPCGGLHL